MNIEYNQSIHIIKNIISEIENTNLILINNLIADNADYYTACIREDSNFNFYEKELQKRWNNVIDKFFNYIIEKKIISKNEIDNMMELNKNLYFSNNWKISIKNLHVIITSKVFNLDNNINRYFYDLWVNSNENSFNSVNTFNNYIDILLKIISEIFQKIDYFFIKIIDSINKEYLCIHKIKNYYFKNLHCLIWANVIKEVFNDIFFYKPQNCDELIHFIKKKIIVCSGPFITKIYNNEKYPIMSENETNNVLSKGIKFFNRYKIISHKCATIGHICFTIRIDKPSKVFVLKIIKPLSVAISCWEHQTLKNKNLEHKFNFIKNILQKNSVEMLAKNEINNILNGFKFYNCDYSEIFDYKLNCKLTTVKYLSDIVKEHCWYIIPMTLAQGTCLDSLDKIKYSKFKLHRTLDLLIYKTLFNLFDSGWYHKELNISNLFYHEFNNINLLTIIDFGSVGNIDLFSSNNENKLFVKFIMYIWFYNYDQLFNDLCVICKLRNKNKQETKQMYDVRNKLLKYRRINFRYHKKYFNIGEMYFESEQLYKEKYNEKKNLLSRLNMLNKTESDINLDKLNINKPDINKPDINKPDTNLDKLDINKPDTNLYKLDINKYDTNSTKLYTNNSYTTEKINPNKINKIELVLPIKIVQTILDFFMSRNIHVSEIIPNIYSFYKAYEHLVKVLITTDYDIRRTHFIVSLLLKRISAPWKNFNKLFKLNETFYFINTFKEEESNFYYSFNNN